MHAFTVDYHERDGRRPGSLVNRGFWLYDIPRPLLRCRLGGHRPVVDGTEGFNGRPGHRWVCCDRCGVRPEPQGSLDPDLPIGQRYTGGYGGRYVPADDGKSSAATREPGPWPAAPTGALGGQLVIGGHHPGLSVQAKVGNGGSEHTLAAHVCLGRLGALYLDTERFGTWLQRRLNPKGYDSRVIGVALQHGRFRWQVWAKRNESSRADPWWMHGSVTVDPRDRLLGPKRYAYADQGAPVTAVVRMPHGDDHEVRMQLQRQTFGRQRGRKRLSWTVECDCRAGVPTKQGGHGRVLGWAVAVSDTSVREGTWPAEASAAAALALTVDRTRYGYKPAEAVVG